MGYKVLVSPEAEDDIFALVNYIARDNSKAALNMESDIWKSFARLKETPFVGVSLAGRFDVDTDYRYIVVAPYLVFYRIVEKTVYIINVLHGSTDYIAKLFGDEGLR